MEEENQQNEPQAEQQEKQPEQPEENQEEKQEEAVKMTLEQFTAFEPGIFARKKGMIPQIHSDFETLWVAEKDEDGNWAIFTGRATMTEEEVKENGDKVVDESTIKLFVPCDDEVYEKYRK